MDRIFMFMKTFCPQGVVCPCSGAIYMYMTIMFKHLQNQKAYDFETWHEASGNGALQSLYKS